MTEELNAEAREVLRALAGDHWLKAHRYLDGTKVFRLHGLDGRSQSVSRAAVDALLAAGLVSSNQKFPAATYTLTAAGRWQANRPASPPAED